MSDLIRLLPDAIANQIAAGEVVQRPASALKELLENAIDAGATKIQVLVKDAGKALIQVMDNGKGMSVTDARMCFERHATSKIRTSEDLFAIRTLGFRGEALASIAAVAQVEMKTRLADDEIGTLIQIEGSELKLQEPTACPVGTSIAVKNLFFNVPARRNFLKSNSVEMRHLVDEFIRIALANPEISFTFHQNDMELFRLNPGKLAHRIVGIFGKTYQGKLIACLEDTDHLKVKGYIGKPEVAKKTRSDQFFFVNNRFIKNNYLHHALCNAFEGLIPSDAHPSYVLFLDIDPKHIDINVHPTKTEIKFDDERTVYAVLRSAVKQALGAHIVMPTLDFNMNVNFAENWKERQEEKQLIHRENQIKPDVPFQEGKYKSFQSNTFSKESLKGWEKLFEGNKEFGQEAVKSNDAERDFSTFPSKANEEIIIPKEQNTGTTFQIENSYIVAQLSSGVLIIDQQTAHERILYERFRKQMQQSSGSCQQSLFPQQVQVSGADFSLLSDMLPELKSLGFDIEIFGRDSILVRGIPADIGPNDEKKLIEDLIEQFKNFKSELSIDKRENIARALAKRTSIKRGAQLANPEMEIMVGQLFSCEQPNYGLSGNKTFVKIDLQQIHAFFAK